jgi:hypothetical protein
MRKIFVNAKMNHGWLNKRKSFRTQLAKNYQVHAVPRIRIALEDQLKSDGAETAEEISRVRAKEAQLNW